MSLVRRYLATFVAMSVGSFGIWAIAFTVSGLWSKDAALLGYHSYSSDTSYLSLRTLVTLVLLGKFIQAAVTIPASDQGRIGAVLAVIAIDNALWFTMFRNDYGIESSGSFDVAFGYGYLILFAVMSNLALATGWVIGAIARRLRS